MNSKFILPTFIVTLKCSYSVLFIFNLVQWTNYKGPDHNYGVQYKLKLNHASVEKVNDKPVETIEGLETTNLSYKASIVHHLSKSEATLRPKVGVSIERK